MAKVSTPKTTTLHEVIITLSGFEKSPICHIDGEELAQWVSVLERDHEPALTLYNVGGIEAPGYDCYVNLTHVIKLNILNVLAGMPLKRKTPKPTDAELEKQIAERDASDAPVILRVWTATDKTVTTYKDVNYNEWMMIQNAFENDGQQFIGFTDEDGERVLLATAHIGAIEVFDRHYLSGKELEARLGTVDEET